MPTKVKFVEYGEQAKAKVVSYGEDMQVVPVEYGEQMKVRIVEYGEDFKVKIVQDTGLCFITTACTQAKGLPDNCPELEIARTFRDTYIKGLPDGEEILREYYQVSPRIVGEINRAKNRQAVYADLYRQLNSAIRLIRQGEEDQAFQAYLSVLATLKQRYLQINE